MRRLPKSAVLILEELISTGKTKIDNSTGDYMPVHIEKINNTIAGTIYSLAHYYVQNGDLMADPEVEILQGIDGNYYPYSFRIDSLGVNRFSVNFDENGSIKGFYPRRQRDDAFFTAKWLHNIKEQQNL
ncbi:MAG TPA: hypothetical protein PKD91_01985 [Bacteroidia bacterium]|nr:hypothetical protein [Bacteroidia bacterium]